MSCINCGNEIHALRTDRASIQHELEEVKAERDQLHEALEELLEACLSTKMMSSDGVVEDARAALNATEGG